MPNPSNIFGWLPGGIKRKELNYADLWKSFVTKTREHEEWAAKVYVPGQHSPIPEQKINQYWESDLIKQETL